MRLVAVTDAGTEAEPGLPARADSELWLGLLE